MKLIGVELENYACFENCFVPIGPGVSALVGKNNSGKTAILRGLTCLRSLPIGQQQHFESGLLGYSWTSRVHRDFAVRVLFEAEATDTFLLHEPEAKAKDWLLTNHAEVIFHFSVWPHQGFVSLEQCILRCQERETTIAAWEGEDFVQVWADSQGQRRGVEPLAASMQGQVLPHGKKWLSFQAKPLLSGLLRLKNVSLIDAHRVGTPRLPLQTATRLASNGSNLPQFLDTLQGNDRERFLQIEAFVTKVFPEYEAVNPQSGDNEVYLTLTLRGRNQRVPITHCGTGVEQILTLASFVLTSVPGGIILIDEPHSYLHPTAERELIRFLSGHAEHAYLISTHSSVIINSVPVDRIIYVTPGKTERRSPDAGPLASEVVLALGYNNSDFLFNDRLIFVEGESDREIIRILLKNSGKLKSDDVEKTGFPSIDGKDKLKTKRGKTNQLTIVWYEKLLQQLGRASIPRIYLLDGDCGDEDRRLLGGITSPATNKPIAVRFLRRKEIENYLFVPEAIAQAIRKLLTFCEVSTEGVTAQGIANRLRELTASDDSDLYPDGKTGDAEVVVKGSRVLERLFSEHKLRYEKKAHGVLIAHAVTSGNQPALVELWDLVQDIF